MPRHAVLFVLLLAVFAATAGCQPSAAQEPPMAKPVMPEPQHATSIVEAACGECQFALPGRGCDLAVRIDGNAYFVDGTAIDEHGDAHAADGFCNTVRHARVAGEIVDGRFVARSFELLPGDGE